MKLHDISTEPKQRQMLLIDFLVLLKKTCKFKRNLALVLQYIAEQKYNLSLYLLKLHLSVLM